jgi:hypothetical protein
MLGCCNRRLERAGGKQLSGNGLRCETRIIPEEPTNSSFATLVRRDAPITLFALLVLVNRACKCVVVTPNRITLRTAWTRISAHVLRRRSCGSTYLSFCCSACRRGVVVKHRVDYLADRDLALDPIEKADEFDVAVAPSSTLSVANRVVVPCRCNRASWFGIARPVQSVAWCGGAAQSLPSRKRGSMPPPAPWFPPRWAP